MKFKLEKCKKNSSKCGAGYTNGIRCFCDIWPDFAEEAGKAKNKNRNNGKDAEFGNNLYKKWVPILYMFLGGYLLKTNETSAIIIWNVA